jgi:hypothetical protein
LRSTKILFLIVLIGIFRVDLRTILTKSTLMFVSIWAKVHWRLRFTKRSL